jgi:hypothetical protein
MMLALSSKRYNAMSLFALALTVCLVPTVQPDGSMQDSCDSYIVDTNDAYTTKRRCINHGLRPEAAKIQNIATAQGGSVADYLQMYGINTPLETIDHLVLSCEPAEGEAI